MTSPSSAAERSASRVAGERPRRGLRTVVIDSGDPGAWQVAAGMLAPVAEVDFGERAQLELGLRSAPRLRGVLRRAGRGVRPRPRAPRRRARSSSRATRDEAAALDRLVAFRRSLGLAVERLRPSEARRAEPALAPTVRLALDVARRPLDRSAQHGRRAGRRVRARRRRAALPHARERGVRRAARASPASSWPTARASPRAPWWWPPACTSPGSKGCPTRPACRCAPSRARSCACATLAAPAWSSAAIRGEQAYLVPRGDGRYVLGATMEERGFDTAPTAGGVHDLIRDMSEIVPGVLELEIEELEAGLRPATPDNLPADRPRRARRAASGRPGTSATGSCSRRSRPSSSPPRWPASELPEWAAAADPRRFAQAEAPA